MVGRCSNVYGVMLALSIKKRDKKENINALRKEGFIPAVYYGRVEKSTPISVPEKDFEKIRREAGETEVITLKYDKDKKLDALIHDIDFDPIKNTPRHVDFYVFEEGRTMDVSVPIEFVNEAPVAKSGKAMIVKVMHEIMIEAMPRSIPNFLEVDISILKTIDDQIIAGDISLPEGVSLKENPEEVVVTVSLPQEEVEEEVEDVDFASIEVEKKGKEEGGDDGETTKEDEGSEEKKKDPTA